MYQENEVQHEAFLSIVQDLPMLSQEYDLAQNASINTDSNYRIVHCINTQAYKAKTRKVHDTHTPFFHTAMYDSYAAKYQKAMVDEVKKTMHQNN